MMVFAPLLLGRGLTKPFLRHPGLCWVENELLLGVSKNGNDTKRTLFFAICFSSIEIMYP